MIRNPYPVYISVKDSIDMKSGIKTYRIDSDMVVKLIYKGRILSKKCMSYDYKT